MATIIVCDGGCGAQSPDMSKRPGPHVANHWLRVRTECNSRFRDGDRWDDKLFCDNCAERVKAAMKPQAPGETSRG